MRACAVRGPAALRAITALDAGPASCPPVLCQLRGPSAWGCALCLGTRPPLGAASASSEGLVPVRVCASACTAPCLLLDAPTPRTGRSRQAITAATQVPSVFSGSPALGPAPPPSAGHSRSKRQPGRSAPLAHSVLRGNPPPWAGLSFPLGQVHASLNC